MSAPPLRVMLVDDHEVVRDGIKLLLADVPDVVVCAEARTARDAVATAAQALPDVIVMDVRLSDGSGIEATRDIRAVGSGQSLLDPAVTKGVLDRLRKGKHLFKDEKLARLSPQEERILARLEVARRAEAAAYLARHTTHPGG